MGCGASAQKGTPPPQPIWGEPPQPNRVSSRHSLKVQAKLKKETDAAVERLRTRELELGPMHASTMSSRGYLVDVLREHGDLDEATRVLGTSVEAMRREFGNNDPATLVMEARAAQLAHAKRGPRGVQKMRDVIARMEVYIGNDASQTRHYKSVLADWHARGEDRGA